MAKPDGTGMAASRRNFLKTAGTVGVAVAGLAGERADASPGYESRSRKRPPPGRKQVLLKGGTVLTMDPKIGALLKGDLLISGSEIVDVGHNINANAHVVDASGTIVIPGLVDAHRHCWQNYFRRAIPNADTGQYVNFTHFGFAPSTRPRDDYAANLISGLSAISSGVTCVLDLHNSRSRAHTDAAIQAHMDTGVRAVLAYGGAPSAVESHLPNDIIRVKQLLASSSDQLVTVRMGGGMSRQDILFARSIGVGLHVDGAFGPPGLFAPPIPQDPNGFVQALEEMWRAGLLGPDITLIHGTAMPDSAFQILKQSGVRLVLATTSDQALRGLADSVPPIQQALDFGITTGLSVDVEVSLSPDLFSQMRGTFNTQRMLANKRWADGDPNAPRPMTVQRVLSMATAEGAMCNGVERSAGTLTPGKKADIVMIEAEDILNMPLNNATGTVVLGADSSSIRNVIINGEFRKWNHRLVDVDLDWVRRLVHESRDYLAAATNLWSPKDIVGFGPLYK